MSVFISLVSKGLHGRYLNSSKRSFRSLRLYELSGILPPVIKTRRPCAQCRGACSAEQKPAEEAVADSEGEPSSANSDNVTVQRLAPLR